MVLSNASSQESQLSSLRADIARELPPIGRILDGMLARHVVNGRAILAEDATFLVAIHHLVCCGKRSTVIRFSEEAAASLPPALLNQGVIYARNRRDPLLGYDPAVIGRFYTELSERLHGSPVPPIPPVFQAYKQALDLFVGFLGTLYFLARRFDPMGGTSHQTSTQPKTHSRTFGRSPGAWLPDSELPLHLVVDNVRR